MNITLTEDLKAFLKEHEHDTLTLKLIHSDYSSPNMNSKSPDITYHPPKDLEAYTHYAIDGIDVYVEQTITATNNHLEFIHEKLLGVNATHVTGVILDNLTIM